MEETNASRRSFVKRSLLASGVGWAGLNVLPGIAAGAAEPSGGRKIKVVCIGAHPDDPESGCAGTLLRYTEIGHAATVIYLTRGERGIPGKSNDEAAAIRSVEAQTACELMGAKPVFAGQIDGSTEFNKATIEAFGNLLAAEAPDVLFAHWPVDTHADHQVASMLAIRAYMALGDKRPQLYFFEVNTGSQSQGFSPTTYVDVSAVFEKKQAALTTHKSQHGDFVWKTHHEIVARFRGREAGVLAAEAFVHLNTNFASLLPPGI